MSCRVGTLTQPNKVGITAASAASCTKPTVTASPSAPASSTALGPSSPAARFARRSLPVGANMSVQLQEAFQKQKWPTAAIQTPSTGQSSISRDTFPSPAQASSSTPLFNATTTHLQSLSLNRLSTPPNRPPPPTPQIPAQPQIPPQIPPNRPPPTPQIPAQRLTPPEKATPCTILAPTANLSLFPSTEALTPNENAPAQTGTQTNVVVPCKTPDSNTFTPSEALLQPAMEVTSTSNIASISTTERTATPLTEGAASNNSDQPAVQPTTYTSPVPPPDQKTDIHIEVQTAAQPPQEQKSEQGPDFLLARLASPLVKSRVCDLENENKKLKSETASLKDENCNMRKSFETLQSRAKALEEHNTNSKQHMEQQQREIWMMRGILLERLFCATHPGEMRFIDLNGLVLPEHRCESSNAEMGGVELEEQRGNTRNSTFRPVGQGCNGCINAVEVVAPNAEVKEIALKMTYNYHAGTKTKDMNASFECEAKVGLLYPCWAMAIIFNMFKAATVLEFLPPELRAQFCTVNNNQTYMEGCQTTKAIPVYNRSLYLTMELGKCNVEHLIAYIFHRDERKPLPAEFGGKNPLQVDTLAFCVLCAVDNLNSHWWFHSDIKLDNIIVVQRPTTTAIFHAISGYIYALCDLGTSLHCPTGKTKPGEHIASNIGNRSPEVLRATNQLPLTKNDVWAVGCVLYEAITGLHPYLRGSDNTLFSSTKLFLIPNEFVDSTPVTALVPYLLERDPAIRPTAKHALLICGALLFLAPHGINLSSIRPEHILQSIHFFNHNAHQVESILLQVHHRNIEAIEPSSPVSTLPRAEKTPSVEQVCSLVFTNEALRDVDGFCAVMLAFCKRRATYYNIATVTPTTTTPTSSC
ncbi:hypothetical protein Pelo_3003 [Pelomyxa schiedti]|nr:hypothetical protein Pelo_3003 [Pelomyxa schiedti]